MELFLRRNKNISTLNFFKKTTPNYFEIFYFDVSEPFIVIKIFKNKILKEIKHIALKDVQIDGGVILNTSNVISILKEYLDDLNKNNKSIEKYFIDLKICSTNIFKSTISLPKISWFKEFKLKQNELKDNFDKYNKHYKLIEDKYNYNLGVVYNEYFIDNNIIKNWLEISKALDIKLSSIQLFSGYLFENIKEGRVDFFDNQDDAKKVLKNGDFAIIHIYNGCANFILSSENKITNTYVFSYTSAYDIINKFILIIGKHEFNFEKKMIKNIFIDSDIELNIEEYLENVCVHNIHFNVFDDMKKDDSSE